MKKKKPKFSHTVGCDPEVFLYDKDGQAYPSTGLLGGNKAFPNPCKGGALQEDNVMAEFNIIPATTAKEFSTNILTVMNELSTIIAKHGLTYKLLDFQEFKPQFLESEATKVFGCEPDYNIYTYEENKVDADTLIKNNIRTAGGHIHLGVEDADCHPMLRTTMVKACDVYIGLPLTVLEARSKRKPFYGKAGSFREKPYGIEYRTPSNIWLQSVETMQWIFNQTNLVIESVQQLLQGTRPNYVPIIRSMGEEVLQQVINCGLNGIAENQCEYWGIQLPPQVVQTTN